MKGSLEVLVPGEVVGGDGGCVGAGRLTAVFDGVYRSRVPAPVLNSVTLLEDRLGLRRRGSLGQGTGPVDQRDSEACRHRRRGSRRSDHVDIDAERNGDTGRGELRLHRRIVFLTSRQERGGKPCDREPSLELSPAPTHTSEHSSDSKVMPSEPAGVSRLEVSVWERAPQSHRGTCQRSTRVPAQKVFRHNAFVGMDALPGHSGLEMNSRSRWHSGNARWRVLLTWGGTTPAGRWG